MAEQDNLRFACEKCNKDYRWKPQLAGKKVQCSKCGHIMLAPATPPGSTAPAKPANSIKIGDKRPDPYDLA